MLIPYGTDRELGRFPLATVILIALNVLVFILSFGLLVTLKAKDPLILNLQHFHWYQPITSMFAHAGLMHLGGNMIVLWVFGSHAEDALGRVKYVILYLTCGLAAEVLLIGVCLAATGSVPPSLGASGAIMGLMALFVFRFPRVRVRILYWFFFFFFGTWEVQALWVALVFVSLELLLGMTQIGTQAMGGVAHWAHIGGFAAGALWAVLLRMPEAAAHDADVDEVNRLLASGAPDLAASKAIEGADAYPDNARLQELAATECEASPKFAARGAGYLGRALRLYLAQHNGDKALEDFERACKVGWAGTLAPDLVMAVADLYASRRDGAGAVRALGAVLNSRAPADLRADAGLRAAQIAAHQMGDRALAARYYRWVEASFPDTAQAFDAHDEMLRMGGG